MAILIMMNISLRCWIVTHRIHWQETRCGTAFFPPVGRAGERGEFQIRPIFEKDVKRISGFVFNPNNPDQSRVAVWIWLKHYVPRAEKRLNRQISAEEICEMYRFGYQGWMKKHDR